MHSGAGADLTSCVVEENRARLGYMETAPCLKCGGGGVYVEAYDGKAWLNLFGYQFSSNYPNDVFSSLEDAWGGHSDPNNAVSVYGICTNDEPSMDSKELLVCMNCAAVRGVSYDIPTESEIGMDLLSSDECSGAKYSNSNEV